MKHVLGWWSLGLSLILTSGCGPQSGTSSKGLSAEVVTNLSGLPAYSTNGRELSAQNEAENFEVSCETGDCASSVVLVIGKLQNFGWTCSGVVTGANEVVVPRACVEPLLSSGSVCRNRLAVRVLGFDKIYRCGEIKKIDAHTARIKTESSFRVPPVPLVSLSESDLSVVVYEIRSRSARQMKQSVREIRESALRDGASDDTVLVKGTDLTGFQFGGAVLNQRQQLVALAWPAAVKIQTAALRLASVPGEKPDLKQFAWAAHLNPSLIVKDTSALATTYLTDPTPEVQAAMARMNQHEMFGFGMELRRLDGDKETVILLPSCFKKAAKEIKGWSWGGYGLERSFSVALELQQWEIQTGVNEDGRIGRVHRAVPPLPLSAVYSPRDLDEKSRAQLNIRDSAGHHIWQEQLPLCP